MFHRVIRSLASAAGRTSAGYVVTLLACVLLAYAWNSPIVHVQAAMKHPVDTRGVPSAAPDAPRFDALRREAASGDERSNLELTAALLDRYDVAGESDDLYEALEWMDRRWDVSDRTELVGRVVANYCGQRVVQWHRLCVLGE
ncbi:hypothetical protein QTI33_04990 [Variovorax sp. J22P271]|uniref:hypothetical protein n=1 Tax=Variovorax davisae TaxID=3053515 RepID=UPI002576DD07|nr:hypothetical protein [Variovorax sp. J22P271]MDM0031494.1 hypothetical protein [Variovorax sp. J22P271]